MDMIYKGYSKKNLGNCNKRVIKDGRILSPNANSREESFNKDIVDVYKRNEIYIGDDMKTPKRLKKETELSVERKTSQISTIPGPHRKVYERPYTVKIKPDFISHISQLPGLLKSPEISESLSKPHLRLSRYTNTTINNENGDSTRRIGPKRDIVPIRIEANSSYNNIGKETDLYPYLKSSINSEAKKRYLSPSSREDTGFTKRSRPENARDMFQSSFRFLS